MEYTLYGQPFTISGSRPNNPQTSQQIRQNISTLVIPFRVNLRTAEQGNADANNKVNNMGSKHE